MGRGREGGRERAHESAPRARTTISIITVMIIVGINMVVNTHSSMLGGSKSHGQPNLHIQILFKGKKKKREKKPTTKQNYYLY